MALVTSGPGATNIVTPLADALLDSVPIVVLSGQVPSRLIGTDAFQECDTVGITRSCTKHNVLVRHVDDLAIALHEAFALARSGRPGPVLVDIPKDVQNAIGRYIPLEEARPLLRPNCQPVPGPRMDSISRAVEMLRAATRPILYTGGGIINSGDRASALLREFAAETGFPVTSTLLGLGAYPASGPAWLGMVGMHGSVEANRAMHDCDVMLALGARFDDRVTGRLDGFSPRSRKIHVDIDPSSINKNVPVEIGIVADVGATLEALLKAWRVAAKSGRPAADLAPWRAQIERWAAPGSFRYRQSGTVIKPQYAIERLFAAARGRETYITTEVGQHQMWAAQLYGFEAPRRFMTSGGLGTMGYGLPAAIGVQAAHPDALVVDIAGEASVQMTMQEMSCAVQYGLPVKIFILNNEWMGMVRQWQQLLHGERYSQSWSAALPDFVKMAEAFGCLGLRATDPAELDAKIAEMIHDPRPVLFDCRVSKAENCYPMIPSGAAHDEMLLAPDDTDECENRGAKLANPAISEAGRSLV